MKSQIVRLMCVVFAVFAVFLVACGSGMTAPVPPHVHSTRTDSTGGMDTSTVKFVPPIKKLPARDCVDSTNFLTIVPCP